MTGSLRFLSHLRVGLAATLTGNTSVPNAQAAYSLSVAGVGMTGQFRLFGPGEVVALEPGQVIRSFPPPASRDHEPNLFAHVELRSADLPWRFTPGGPSGGKLRPWLVLVVVEATDRVKLEPRGSRLPVLKTPVSELPNLAESWAWAHVQVTLEDPSVSDLQALYAKEPHRFLARLICPRKLEANKNYLACLVPAFDAGRDAGLGVSVAQRTTLKDAWSSAVTEVSLPVYHSWSFSCAGRGDFEYLADQLRPRPAPADLGVAELDVSAPGLGLAGIEAGVPMVGALCAPGAHKRMTAAPSAAENALRGAIWKVVSEGATLPLPVQAEDPIVAPPRYGMAQTGAEQAPPVAVDAQSAARLSRHRRAGRRTRAHASGGSRGFRLGATRGGRQTPADAASRRVEGSRQRAPASAPCRAWQGQGRWYLVFARPMCANVASGDKTFLRRLREDTDVPQQVSASATTRLAVRAGRIRRHRSLPAPSAAGMTSACLSPETRPDFAPVSGLGTRTVARKMQPVDTSALKAVPGISAAIDNKLLALHPGKGRVPTTPMPPKFRGGGSIGKDLWDATEPSGFMRSHRRRLVSADSELGLGSKGPLPTRLKPALEFRSPFGANLAKMAPEYLLPKVGKVPNNTVATVEVNTAFIEAFLAGMNGEWTCELIWRELPAAPRATSMRRFWDCEDRGDQIPAIRQWSKTGALGSNATPLAGGSGLALLIKGRLLDRYPETLVYAVRARWAEGRREPFKAPTAQQILWPDVVGQVAPGVRYFIFFKLGVAECNGTELTRVNPSAPGNADPGWFFVLEEQACAPRFGLDLPASGPSTNPTQWDELTWAHVTTAPATGAGARHLTLTPPRGIQTAAGAVWAAGSAHMAWITLQTPYRVYVHGSSMLAGANATPKPPATPAHAGSSPKPPAPPVSPAPKPTGDAQPQKKKPRPGTKGKADGGGPGRGG